MHPKRPNQVKPHHLRRFAAIYIRVAALSGMDHSLTHQRAQAQIARQWGWPEGFILVIDEDIGQSGTATTARSGFRRLCQMIEAGNVGIVIVSDMARLSRSLAQLVDFLRLCERKDVLVAVDGILGDLSTMYLRESSPMQVARNSGLTAYQRRPPGWRGVLKIREIFRRFPAAGKGDSEIAEEFNKRGVKTI